MKATVLSMAAAVWIMGCGSSTYTLLTRSAEMPDNVQKAMRGGARLGCDVSETYDSLVGVIMDCKDGRIVVSKPTGENMSRPGDPLQVTCFRSLGNQEECEAFWSQIEKKGEAPCSAQETGVGCGELKCSGAIDQHGCESVFRAK